ncbi:hypothetical protein BGX33_008658 [Mortierella sp. NVP41]|nr:hypothetical protein BGX33_008658 [Mortierella sp. NVP41]
MGSALNFAGQIMPLFRQLWIDEKFLAISRYLRYSRGAKEGTDDISQLDSIGMEEFFFQVRSLPARFISAVLITAEQDDKATIHTADKCVYTGDILVGADGAYSAVRQRLNDSTTP